MDERFLVHRLSATRYSAIVGVILMAMWTVFDWYAHHHFRWDMLTIMLAMGLTKWVGVLCYRRAN
jgi:hypothetical protein